ncbi:hypothetical protein COCCU_01415 [Corynebacterium occultum]|uniref:Heparan-alpha-glucosaminide N-acetyltransferase catalytic domain-containing protein n=1 Tax=Corynebacterium occultum TaxID=2675219 RepID=A0A6B8VY27_9CORY|nr:heparan-alpha-glucosaminide N-acetyltransferase domain-containing protein [Corynebacterium occultum]QGU06244.1 hypothetical protein COCCU_01415 [Corynebacterium occultum]
MSEQSTPQTSVALESTTPQYAELVPYAAVPEGDSAPGIHPTPGPRPQRLHWTGRRLDGEPVLLDETPDVKEEAGYERQFKGRRLIGLDVARGLALIGMVAVHTIPAWNPITETRSIAWIAAAGNASALFALLAGVGMALMTRGPRHEHGSSLRSQRFKIAIRALLLYGIGILVTTFFVTPVYNILPYYAVMFLLLLPFLGMRKRQLAVWALGLAITMPFVIHLFRYFQPFDVHNEFLLGDFFLAPMAIATSLFFTGTYPAATWIVYLLVGLMIGRLALDRLAIQVSLLGYGALLGIMGHSMSYLSIWFFGGWERMLYSAPEVTVREVLWMIRRGADYQELPATSLAWLTVASPHTNTFFALVQTTGNAMMALGACLLLCRIIPKYLGVLAFLGSMTLTLYTAHLIFLTSYLQEEMPYLSLTLQLIVGTAFVYLWSRFFRQGPLEWVVAKVSGFPPQLLQARQRIDTSASRRRRARTRTSRKHHTGLYTTPGAPAGAVEPAAPTKRRRTRK